MYTLSVSYRNRVLSSGYHCQWLRLYPSVKLWIKYWESLLVDMVPQSVEQHVFLRELYVKYGSVGKSEKILQ
jgi:hypothetical protein